MIRNATIDDLPAITLIYNQAIRSTAATYDIDLQRPADRTEWFEQFGEDNPLLVYEEDGRVVGYAGLSPFGPDDGYLYSVNLSIYLHSDIQGEGKGTELMEAVIHLAQSMENIKTIVSEITDSNKASIALHERFGFEYVGKVEKIAYKFDEFHDMRYYQLHVD